MKQPAVYILANHRDGVLYTGVTSNLVRRVWTHKQGFGSGFTSKYNVKLLVYFELTEDMCTAITREKQIKGGPRRAKIALIERQNPDWKDLYFEII